MELRRFKIEDISVLYDLYYETIHEINRYDYTGEQLNAWATKRIDLRAWEKNFMRNYTLVAMEDKVMVGFGDVDKNGYVDKLIVHKDYQGQGIASAILAELEKRVLELGLNKIKVNSTITALRFYRKRGYTITKNNVIVCKNCELLNYFMAKPIDNDNYDKNLTE